MWLICLLSAALAKATDDDIVINMTPGYFLARLKRDY